MAQMYPETLPSDVLQDPKRRAEVRVYDALKRDLDATFHVFYSVAWVFRQQYGAATDGEADFVILHPDGGVLVLEVKGGGVSMDGRTGTWSTIDRNQTKHAIKNPFEQAKNGKYRLLEKIRSLPRWSGVPLRGGHGVVLPDISLGKISLGPNAPRDVVLDRDGVASIGRWVRDLYAYWRKETPRYRSLSASEVDTIRDALAPTVTVTVRLAAQIADDERAILALSDKQLAVLNLLKRNRRMCVSGGAGTGKTVLAFEKARRLASEGFRTLLTCFSRPLADKLRADARGLEGLDVQTFHQLCWAMGKKAGMQVGEPSAPKLNDSAFCDALFAALERVADRYDAVIVDEGQDFDASWLTALEFVLADGTDGVFYVFRDDNQRIYRRVDDVLRGFVSADLTENWRNTRTIHEFTQAYYTGPETTSLGPAGRPLERLVAEPKDQVAAVEKLLSRLIAADGVDAGEIAVLSGVALEKSPLARKGTIGRHKVGTDAHGKDVVLQTIHRFKGLERPVVIVTDLDQVGERDLEKLLYVGASRARTHLVLVASKALYGRLSSINAGQVGERGASVPALARRGQA